MSRPIELTDVHCELVQETDKAILVNIQDDDLDLNEREVWIPKMCVCEDDFDRDGELQGLRDASSDDELFPIAIQTWWLHSQDWFGE